MDFAHKRGPIVRQPIIRPSLRRTCGELEQAYVSESSSRCLGDLQMERSMIGAVSFQLLMSTLHDAEELFGVLSS